MQLCIDLENVVDTTIGYASSINVKVQSPRQNIKSMVHTQLISCGHIDELWCYLFSIYHLYHLTPHQQKPFYSSHCCLVKSQYHILNHSIHWPCNEGMQNLHHQLKARGKVIVPCTNKFTCACISSKYPSLIHPSTDGFFMGYFNSSKVVI